MGAPRKCECGDCNRCNHRERMRRWTAHNRDKTRAWARRYRENNLELVREKDRARGSRVYDRAKVRARSLVHAAVKRGDLRREPCEVCGHFEVQAHHDDYGKPLEVRWLCTKHHGELHRVAA